MKKIHGVLLAAIVSVTAVFTAIDHAQAEVLSMLLKHGLPCVNNRTQQTALDRAAVFGTPAVMKILVEAGENVDGLTDQELDRLTRGTPLRDAISCGHAASAELLVQHGAHIDICSAAGLGWAGWVTRRLNDHPDEADITDDWHYTPLCYAVAAGCAGTPEALRSHGADSARTYDDGGTLLEQATQDGYHDLMAVLLAHGVDVNARNRAGAGRMSPISLGTKCFDVCSFFSYCAAGSSKGFDGRVVRRPINRSDREKRFTDLRGD